MNAEKLRKARTSKPFRPADILIYLACVALTAAVLIASFTAGGDTVEIVQAGERHEYSLDEDRTLDLGCLTVVIRDGKVWVEDADCPDKVCEHTGRIGYGGADDRVSAQRDRHPHHRFGNNGEHGTTLIR